MTLAMNGHKGEYSQPKVASLSEKTGQSIQSTISSQIGDKKAYKRKRSDNNIVKFRAGLETKNKTPNEGSLNTLKLELKSISHSGLIALQNAMSSLRVDDIEAAIADELRGREAAECVVLEANQSTMRVLRAGPPLDNDKTRIEKTAHNIKTKLCSTSLPDWYCLLQKKIETGEIPKYKGIRKSGCNPIEFTKKWYGSFIDSGHLMQVHLRALDPDLLKKLSNYITYEKRQGRMSQGFTAADVVPSISKNKIKT